MIRTSENYEPFAQVRQVDCLISFEVLAKTLNKKNIAVTAPSARVGSGPLTVNGIPELVAKYGTLERYGWPLDGSCDLLPSSGAETGYWSSAVSDDGGDFDDPVSFRYDLPSDTATFGWTFHFDAPAMITASLVRAVCYDAGGGVVDTAEGYVEGTVDPPRPTVTVGIEPVQAGSGDPSPDNVRPITGRTGAKVTRCGKNLLKPGSTNFFRKGTYRIQEGVVPKGQAAIMSFRDKDTSVDISNIYIGFVPDDYTTGVLTTFRWAIANGRVASNTSNAAAFGDIGRLLTDVAIYPTTNDAVNRLFARYDIQVELGSTATDYEPYQGETYDITFPAEAGTVYGGTLDVARGVLTVDRAMIASYAGEALPSGWISDRDVYAAGTAPTTGAQVVYELASPVVYPLTPVEISQILDTDNVWADCGPVLDIGSVPGNRPQIVKSGSGWSFHHYVQNYRAVEFTFYGTNLPRRMLRLAEIDFGVSKHFNRDSIKSARIKYGMTPDSSAFPAKEIVFTFDNSDGDFNVLNPIGVYQYWRNGQVLTARIKVGDEIVPMGLFYVTKAEIGENRLLAKVTAHDPCYQLANQKFYPTELAEAETVRLDEAVPRALIGSDLEVDYGGLEAEPVSVAVRDTHDKRVILRYLAQAVRAAVWIDRDNVLRFRRIATAEEEDGSITADELYNWSGVSISEEYTGVTLTVNRELQKDADGNDVTETYRSGVLDSEGTHTATYENPCVAAESGQAVADWLLVTANRRKKYAVKNRCDPAVEIGDTLVIADAFHNDDRAVVTGLDIEFDGGLVCVTEADREF